MEIREQVLQKEGQLCKGPGAGPRLACTRNSQEVPVARAEGARWGEGRPGTRRGRSCRDLGAWGGLGLPPGMWMWECGVL